MQIILKSNQREFHFKILYIFLTIILLHCENANANDFKIGKKYKTIKTLFIEGVYNNSSNTKLSKESASAFISQNKHYKKSNIAFQNEIPTGTIITIIGRVPKPWYSYFNSDRYFVKLEPDLSQGLEVILSVDSLLEKGLGTSIDLKSDIFTPIP